MNNFFVILFVSTVALMKSSTAAPIDDLKNMMINIKEQCVAETKIPDDVLAQIKKHEPITSRDGKCFKACIMEKIGVLGPDNRIAKDKILESAKVIYDADENKLSLAAKVFDECNQTTETERCEAANYLCDCIFTHKDTELFKQLM